MIPFWKVELPLRAAFYPLGFGFEISVNSQAVLDAANQSWGVRNRARAAQLSKSVSE